MSYSTNVFWASARRTVYKWWCVVYKPTYKLFHKGYWPNEKDPYVKYPEPVQDTQTTTNENTPSNDAAIEMANKIASQISSEHNNAHFDELQQSLTTAETSNESTEEIDTSNLGEGVLDKANEIMERLAREAAEDEAKKQAEIEEAKKQAAQANNDATARANEIMERLAKEAAEDEAKKQAEIDAAKQKAAEDERLASIMKANQVDISQFIEEGKANQDL